jgi:Raf kinase inhibitor-like YbhB/YbcL family protein
MPIKIDSPAFAHGAPIPKKYTGDGEDVSPALNWSAVPSATRQLALICDDPDAPTPQPWVHWVIYRLPPSTTALPEGVAKSASLEMPAGAVQGKNSWTSGQQIGYRGPAPPPGHGVHHYHFRLYALDTALDLPPGAAKQELLDAMEGHVLGQGELVGTYER